MDGKSLILYHGTDSKILNPDLTKCNAYRDFGRMGDLFHFDLLKKEFCSKQEQLAKP